MKHEQHDVDRAIGKLKSLSEAGCGIVDILACGRSAIPALRQLLFEREPSGLFQVRCRVVDALAALNAYEVLVEYLGTERATTDSVERLGNDAVINYAAWSVARTREEGVFALLLQLARRPALNGVIGALGTFERSEAIPFLVNALEEDSSRNVAEFMLRRMGSGTRTALLESAQRPLPPQGRESESSRRRRRSSLSLLAEIGLGAGALRLVRPIMWDDDTMIAFLACKLWLLHAPAGERPEAIDRLAALVPSADWMLREEIETILAIFNLRATSGGTRRAIH
jgi:hypothetical protein